MYVEWHLAHTCVCSARYVIYDIDSMWSVCRKPPNGVINNGSLCTHLFVVCGWLVTFNKMYYKFALSPLILLQFCVTIIIYYPFDIATGQLCGHFTVCQSCVSTTQAFCLICIERTSGPQQVTLM